MKPNETQLSLNINEKLLKEFKIIFEEDDDFELLQELFKEKLMNFFIEMKVDKNDGNSNNTKPMSIVIPKRYKSQMIDIKKSDNEFYSMREIIEYIMKDYIKSKK